MQKSITAAAPPPQQSPPSQLHFLGVPVSCESRGIGFVVFEETGAAKEYRMLRVIFEHGSPLEAVPVVLESWHVRFHFDRPVLKLPVERWSFLGKPYDWPCKRCNGTGSVQAVEAA